MKRALFIDRDGTLVIEPPVDYQLDSLEKLVFYPKVFRNLYFIRKQLDFEFVMVTNQDGLGTDSFPEDTFWPAHDKMLKTLEGEGIRFDDILIDRSFPEENSPNRKPRTGMLGRYLSGEYDLANSYVIGDRLTDMQLAANLGAKGIWLRPDDVEARQLLTENTAISPVPSNRYPNVFRSGRAYGRRSRDRWKSPSAHVRPDSLLQKYPFPLSYVG